MSGIHEWAERARKVSEAINELGAGPPAPRAGLTDDDRDMITRARALGPALRASSSDRDRLAGWLLKELADLAERLDDDAYIREHGDDDLDTGHLRDPDGDEAAHG
jgi:hypothetical protein